MQQCWTRLMVQAPRPAQYMMAIYYVITTMATVGYGDVRPVTLYELAVALFIMVCDGIIHIALLSSEWSVGSWRSLEPPVFLLWSAICLIWLVILMHRLGWLMYSTILSENIIDFIYVNYPSTWISWAEYQELFQLHGLWTFLTCLLIRERLFSNGSGMWLCTCTQILYPRLVTQMA